MRYGNSQSGLTILWHTYRRGAKARDYEFSLTKDEFRELTKGDCWYCGVEPAQIRHSHNTKDCYLYNGIDRVDNTEGYVYTNCVPCCGTCNSMKRTHTVEVFLAHVRKIMHNLYL